jgi:hypothetical protein
MRAYRAEAYIAAPPDAVWAVLVDFDAYPSWNPFTVEVECSGELGAPVRMRVFMRGRMTLTQVETLHLFEPGARLGWKLDIGVPWLLCAERVQTLTALDGGATRYETVDEIGGMLAPVSHWIFGSAITWGFQAVAASLKARAEALAAEAHT